MLFPVSYFLGKREAAIVSEIPGTTRDVIETTVNFHGYPVVFADTAGIRSSTGDVIESEGVKCTFMLYRLRLGGCVTLIPRN